MPFSKRYEKLVLDRGFQNFKHRFREEFFKVQKAHLCMLFNNDIITAETARKLKKSIMELEKGFSVPEKIPEDVEDYYFLFEKALSEMEGEETAGYLHAARSRNDMDTTIFRLYVRKRLLSFLSGIEVFFEKFYEKIKLQKDSITILFTHGQPANPSTLAHYLSSFFLEISESVQGLLKAYGNVNSSTMGACAITGTGFKIDRESTAKFLGMDDFVLNTYQAISTSHWLVFPSMWLGSLARDLTRFSADLIHKASAEVGIIDFPDELVQISSIMPQKRNPVILEHIRIQAGTALGIFSSVENLFHNVPFQDVNEVADAPVETFSYGLDLLESALLLFEEAVCAITGNTERVLEIAEKTGVNSTELADSLVKDKNLNFRQAHRIVSLYVKKGFDFRILSEEFKKSAGKELLWDEEEVKEILSTRNFIAVRKVTGGPSEEGMARIFETMDLEIQKLKIKIEKERFSLEIADRSLEESFSSI